jgi:CheY-like chemotaxis protein
VVRVLLLDDDRDGANSTAMLLRHFGAEARAICDPRLVCDEARSFDPDLMLIDFSMPHLDGCAVAKQLRGTQQSGATPLVVVSGHTAPEHCAWRLASTNTSLSPCRWRLS